MLFPQKGEFAQTPQLGWVWPAALAVGGASIPAAHHEHTWGLFLHGL